MTQISRLLDSAPCQHAPGAQMCWTQSHSGVGWINFRTTEPECSAVNGQPRPVCPVFGASGPERRRAYGLLVRSLMNCGARGERLALTRLKPEA